MAFLGRPRPPAAISAGEGMYAPIATAIWFATENIYHLQFLTIRKYLSLAAAHIALLLTVAIWR